MKVNFYTLIKYLSLFCAPFSPAVFFGGKIYTEATELGFGFYLSLAAAISAAIALETVGILAGHAMITFFGQKKYFFSGVALLILGTYVGLGVYELWATAGAIMFGVAFLVYVLIALKEEAERMNHELAQKAEAEQAERQTAHDDRVAQLEREARLAHETELAKIAAQKEIALAKLQATQNVAPVLQVQRNTQQNSNAEAIIELHRQGVKQADIARELNVPPYTVSRVLKPYKQVSAD